MLFINMVTVTYKVSSKRGNIRWIEQEKRKMALERYKKEDGRLISFDEFLYDIRMRLPSQQKVIDHTMLSFNKFIDDCHASRYPSNFVNSLKSIRPLLNMAMRSKATQKDINMGVKQAIESIKNNHDGQLQTKINNLKHAKVEV